MPITPSQRRTKLRPHAVGLRASPFASAIRVSAQRLDARQADIGAHVGASLRTVSEWFAGVRVPDDAMLLRLARRLDIDPAHLLRLAGLHRATLAEILGGGE